MKKIAIAVMIFLFAFNNLVFAQRKEDYYKFNEHGTLCEFQLTIPDGVQVIYVREKKSFIKLPDGTTIDFSKSIFNRNYDNAWQQDYTLLEMEDGYPNANVNHYIEIEKWYKDIRKLTNVPAGNEILNSPLGLREFTITFKDQSFFTNLHDSLEYIDVSEDGDILHRAYGHIQNVQLKNSPIIDQETKEIISTAKLASGVKETDIYSAGDLNGQVFIEDGSIYIGNFRVMMDKKDASVKSKYLRNLLSAKGLGNVVGVYFTDGKIVTKNNKIVAVYRYGKKLDDFDMASVVSVEQGKIDREKAEAKKAAMEQNAILKKYGKKYANAFFSGKIIVGMPWSLVEIGLKAHSFKNFYMAILTANHYSSYGNSQRYSLVGHNLGYVGYMQVVNGRVETVTYY